MKDPIPSHKFPESPVFRKFCTHQIPNHRVNTIETKMKKIWNTFSDISHAGRQSWKEYQKQKEDQAKSQNPVDDFPFRDQVHEIQRHE